jgi:multidrug efflux pump subunit AcrA (membrane-fusion protein)
MLAAALAVIAATWFATAPIEPVVDAVGRTVPESGVRTLAAAEGGVLNEITAAPGARVAEDTVLARILVPGLDAEERRTERDLALARAEAARVSGFAEGGPQSAAESGTDAASTAALRTRIRPRRSEATAEGASPGTAAGTASAAPASRSEAAELAAAQLRVAVSARALGEARASVAARRSITESAAARAAAIGAAARAGLEPRATAELAESERSHAAADLGAALAAEARAAATLEAARAEVAAEALRRRAGRDDARSRADLALSAAQAALDRVRARRALTELRAPTAGRVTRVTPKGTGSLLGAGETLVELSPDGPVAVELEIDPARGEWLRSGLVARLVPLDRPRTKAIPGRVTAVTPTLARDGAPRLLVRVVADTQPSAPPRAPDEGTVADAKAPRLVPPMIGPSPVLSSEGSKPVDASAVDASNTTRVGAFGAGTSAHVASPARTPFGASRLQASDRAPIRALEPGIPVRVASPEARLPVGVPPLQARTPPSVPALEAGTPVRVLILGDSRTPWRMLADALAPPR